MRSSARPTVSKPTRNAETAKGVAYAAAAYLFWGLFPLYFHQLSGVAAPEILAHRIVWSAVFLLLVITAGGHWREVRQQLLSRSNLSRLAVSGVCISTNWLIYVWAVTSGHVLDASLGYYINPLITIVLSVFFLRESLTRRQWLAVALAAAGVLTLTLRAHHVPWIALALALTFGLYGLVRKRVAVDATSGLLAEVGLLTPMALLYMAWLRHAGADHFAQDAKLSALLAATGIVTAVPLIWFALGVQRLQLSVVGILQYINPTVQFAIAVFVFDEPFTPAHAVSFGCIWLALVLYTSEAWAAARAAMHLSAGGRTS